jgi:ribosome biogenesis GTPase A
MVRVRYSFGSRHTGRIANIKKQRQKYPDVMRDVIRISDIILEIIDARYIEETRNKDIEEYIQKEGKKIIYILNKADLVNIANVKRKLPKDMRPYVFISATKLLGSKDLRTRIKIEAKKIDLTNVIIKSKKAGTKERTLDESAKRVHIGIIGYPNVRKSSIINVITRRGAVGTSKQAGYTKGIQKIRMSEGILIIDTPGVIQESKYSSNVKIRILEDAKIGARTYSDVKDPENIVYYLMTHDIKKNRNGEIIKDSVIAKKIESFYEIDANRESDILIKKLGQQKNFLGKGGIIDVDRTSRLILRDWQEGKIVV